jgi:anti-sigma regulatory factor (Ser/Thr protein kinase)
MGAVGPVSIFFLMMRFGVMGFSYGVILMEGAGALLVFLFILIMKKVGRYPGKGVLLLPTSEKKESQVDLSIPAKEEEISAVVEALQNAAFEISKDETASAMLALAAEEIIANTIAYGYRHHGPSQYIDVNLAKTEQGILVRIRDDGIAFDPTTYQPGDEEDMRFHGIEIIRKVAKDFKYLRLLNTNNTIIEIPMGEKIA